MVNEISCPLCGLQNTTLRYPHLVDWEYRVTPSRPFGFRRCGTCTFWFLAPRPNEEEILSFYPRDYHAYEEDRRGLTRHLVAARQFLRRRYYLKLLGPGAGKAIFDVGCGDCRNFEMFAGESGFRLAGVEIQPALARRARQRGYEVYHASTDDFDEAPLEGQFDLVTMNHLLEHVLNPLVVLRKCARLLKPGGFLVGELPSIDSLEYMIFRRDWAGFHFPRHLQAFSQKTLVRALCRTGFDKVRITSPPHPGQWAISFQNTCDRYVVRLPRKQGKGPLHPFWLLMGLGFACLEKGFRISGIVGFEARRAELSL